MIRRFLIECFLSSIVYPHSCLIISVAQYQQILLHSYNLITKAWSVADSSPRPTGRFGHSMVFYDVSCISRSLFDSMASNEKVLYELECIDCIMYGFFPYLSCFIFMVATETGKPAKMLIFVKKSVKTWKYQEKMLKERLSQGQVRELF